MKYEIFCRFFNISDFVGRHIKPLINQGKIVSIMQCKFLKQYGNAERHATNGKSFEASQSGRKVELVCTLIIPIPSFVLICSTKATLKEEKLTAAFR